MRRSETLAAVDIGTNSLHGVVARMTDGGHGPPLRDPRAREGDGAARIERRRHARARPPTPSTAPSRPSIGSARSPRSTARRSPRSRHPPSGRPTTGTMLIDRAWDEARVAVNVISGVEEARLIHLGVLQAVPVYDRRLLLCDIGGGSTELLVGPARRGAVVSLAEARRDPPDAAVLRRQAHAPGRRRRLSPARALHDRAVRPRGPQPRRRGRRRLVRHHRRRWPRWRRCGRPARGRARSATSRSPSTSSTTWSRSIVEAPTPEARAELPGLDASRADIILAGAIILEQVMHELGLDELVVSDYALREGVLLDTWRRRHGGSLHHLSDLRRQSVLSLAELMDEDQPHSAQVARLALELFDADAGSPRARRRRSRDPRGRGPAVQRGHVPVPRAAPQAQLLRDPRHRSADRVQRRRGRAHRARRPLPPQVRARARSTPSSRRSTTTPSTRCACSRGCCGSRSASTATTPPGSVR